MALMLIPGHDRDTIHPDSIIAQIDLDLDRLFTVPANYVFIGGEPVDESEASIEARDRAQRLADAEPCMTAAEYRAEARASIRAARRAA